MVHFQLTSRCNLRCPFCGQWGTDGFMKNEAPMELPFDVWKNAADSIAQYCRRHNLELPDICLWGGEPLLHPDFEEISAYLYACGFNLGVVTNGYLLPERVKSINPYFKTVYLSIDGPEQEHDRIRGCKGLWSRIAEGLVELDENIHTVVMCAITGSNVDILEKVPFAAGGLRVDSLLLQNLIFLDAENAADIKSWLQREFNQVSCHIDSWVDADPKAWVDRLPAILQRIETHIEKGTYPVKTEIRPKELTSKNILDWYRNPEKLENSFDDHCLSPVSHLSITAKGNVTPCVDFDAFSAGNILENDVMEIWNNEITRKYGKEINARHNRFCLRCPWRFNPLHQLDKKTAVEYRESNEKMRNYAIYCN